MGVDLLKHNQEAYERVQKAISEGKKKIAVSHATGTGKTYLIAKLFEDYSNDKKLVLVPSTYISDQIQALFEKYHIQNVDIMRYQKLIKMSDEDITSMDYSVIALDEYHHDTSKVWGEKVRKLIDTHPEAIIFGTSATPIRTDGVNAIDELFEGNCVSDLHLSESIAKKIVPLPKYVGALYTLDDELEKLRKKVENATNTKEEKQEFYKKINTMRSQIEKSYGMPIILNKHIKNKEGKYIIFCKKKKHLREIKDTVIGWFKTAGFKNINAYEVYSDYENKDAEYKAFCDDTSHNLKLLFCVNMLNEGLHLENISGVLLLRPTRSMIIFLQQIGRAIEANNVNTPVIIDAVNNFSAIGQGMELLGEIKEAVAKEKESDPNFDDSGFIDIDTFFVVEQIVEIQKMFREIEGRLQGSWDAMFKEYCKFYEENGHGDVPKTKEYRKLNTWCKHQRQNLDNEILKEEYKKLLNDNKFIWDVSQYRFEKQVIETRDFILKNGRYPKTGSDNKCESNLGYFISAERTKKRQAEKGETNYPKWKLQIINKVIPDFCWNPIEESFNTFLHFLIEYLKETGKSYVEKNVIFKGYKLGKQFRILKDSFDKGNIPDYKKEALMKLGITFEDTTDMRYRDNWKLLEKCVDDGIVLNSCNRKYENVDLYSWIKGTVKRHIEEGEKLSERQIKLIDKVLQWKRKIKVIDLKSSQVYVYPSTNKASEAMYSVFLITKNAKSACVTINNHLLGKTMSPYKGRFMFYYATEEVVKKYLENNKVN